MESTGAKSFGVGKGCQEFCYTARDETTGLDLGEQRKKKWSEGNLPGFLADVTYGLAGGTFWIWRLGYSNKWEKGG